jgi:hypothetical protein
VNQDGILIAIYLTPSGDWPTLGEIVDELGEPDAFSIPSSKSRLPGEPCSCSTLRPGRLDPYQLPDLCSDDDGECQEQYWSIIVEYPDRGLKLFIDRYLEEFPCVCREMLVDGLFLVTVPAYVDEDDYRWPGFGRVDLDQLEMIGADDGAEP